MLENYLDVIVHDLVVSFVVSSFQVLKREVGEEDGYIRVKCNLSNGDILEFAEYIQLRKNMIYLETYSFHWQSADGNLVKRWDNVKHHKEVGTYPYHLHLPNNTVIDSEPMNLKKVLAEIGEVLPIKESEGRR